MKSAILLLVVIFLSVSFQSCQKDDFALNGIEQTDNPPLPLSKNSNQFWVEKSYFSTIEEISDGCDGEYNQFEQQWYYTNCGMYRTIEVKIYFGTLNNVRYISKKTITLIMDQDTYHHGRDLSEKFGTIKGYFGNRNNPVNLPFMRVNNFQEL